MENINIIDKDLEDYLYNPLILLTIKDESIINRVNKLLPYSTGFEIECSKSEFFKNSNFTIIPNILDVSCDNGEQRYRIPNGIPGLICLFNICNQLKIDSLLNFGSGIHYHIDTTDCFKDLVKTATENQDWILNELDTWNYKGDYNKRGINPFGNWLKFNSLETFEFRIGEMSFDYKVLVNRIIHANNIVKRLKDQINIPEPTYPIIEADKILDYLKSKKSENHRKLLELDNKLNSKKEQQNKEEFNKINIQQVINNRIIRL